MGGRVRRHRHAWRVALKTLSRKVARTLRLGSRLPLRRRPHQEREPRHPPLSEQDKVVVRREIREALYHGALAKVAPEFGQILSPITLNEKKDRLCINFRTNKFISPKSYRESTARDFLSDILPGDYAVKTDLKKAFWSIPVCKEHRKLLRFRWEGCLYEFQTLPFGLSSSPAALRTMTKPVVRRLRQLGLRVHLFVDDLIILHQCEKEAMAQLAMATELFHSLGFLVNWEKTSKEPTQFFEFLGLQYNTVDYTTRAPPSKIKDIRKMARRLLQQAAEAGQLSPRRMASLVGKLQFIRRTLLKGHARISQLLDWNKEALASARKALGRSPNAARRQWDRAYRVNGEVLSALKWFARMCKLHSGAPLAQLEPAETWLTDAGPHGYGFVKTTKERDSVQEHAGVWTSWEASQSTNYRELKVLWIMLDQAPHRPSRSTVEWQTDSKVALFVARKARCKTKLVSELATSITFLAERKNIWLQPRHVSQAQVARADALSRIADATDDALSEAEFERVRRRLGARPSVDAMATRFTAKTRRFWSLKDDQGAAHDAMAQSWTGKDLYIFPPIRLIPQVMDKIKQDHPREVLLVTPDWPSATWHHALTKMASRWTRIREGAIQTRSSKRGGFRYIACKITLQRSPQWKA